MSHRSRFELTKLALPLEDIYDGLTVNCGKVYDYLGMDLNFSEDGSVKVSMIKYLNNVLRDFP